MAESNNKYEIHFFLFLFPCPLQRLTLFLCLMEYTIYKMYNQVTDLSMKVRLVKILYFDTSLGKKLFKKYSFFIEDKERVAERNDAFDKDRFLTPFDLNSDNFKKLSFFQYMIGNRDWFITSRKNIDIIQPNDTTKARAQRNRCLAAMHLLLDR
jgi:hypothetical protein